MEVKHKYDLGDGRFKVIFEDSQFTIYDPEDIYTSPQLKKICNAFTNVEPLPEEPIVITVPDRITMRQAKLTLSRIGVLIQAENMILNMHGDVGVEARIEWENSSSLERNNPLCLMLGAALGLADAEIDALFVWAKDL